MYPEILGVVKSYGLMLAVSFALGLWLSVRRGRRYGLAAETVTDLVFGVLVSSIVGVRLMFVLTHLGEFHPWYRAFFIWDGGLTLYGGIILATLTVWWMCRRQGLRFLDLADIFSPGVALGIGLTRIGCFLAGCCFGRPSDCALAVHFPADAPAVHQFGLVAVHPTQLYASAAGFAVAGLLLLWERRPSPRGATFWRFLLLYGAARFVEDLFRYYEPEQVMWPGWSNNQWISVALAAAGVAGLLRLRGAAEARVVADVLELGPDGWLRQGRLWRPTRPLYAVLGDPVAHSLSPRMQGAALRDRGLAADYLAARVAAGDLRRLKDRTGDLGLAGANVTAPHKEAVAALCDGRTDQARALGAVNTVKIEDGRWLGHNTDSGGVLAVLSQAWGAAPPPLAVVLGAGGSARAAVDALLRWPVPRIEVRARPGAGRERLADWLTERDVDGVTEIGDLTPEPPAPDSDAVWLGCLAGGVAPWPFLPVAAGAARAFYFDLRYGDQLPPGSPPLGFAFSDGLPLLLMQGGLSFSWWFGPPVPWAAMHAALG